MKVSATESEENGRTEMRAQRIDVGDGACKEHGDSRGARGAGESGAL